MPVEGVLNPISGTETFGLNLRTETSKARGRGEAGAPAKRVVALLPEGVLNPINGTSAATHVVLPHHLPWGVMTWVPGDNRRYHAGLEQGGSGSFAAGGGAERERRTSEARVRGEALCGLRHWRGR